MREPPEAAASSDVATAALPRVLIVLVQRAASPLRETARCAPSSSTPRSGRSPGTRTRLLGPLLFFSTARLQYPPPVLSIDSDGPGDPDQIFPLPGFMVSPLAFQERTSIFRLGNRGIMLFILGARGPG